MVCSATPWHRLQRRQQAWPPRLRPPAPATSCRVPGRFRCGSRRQTQHSTRQVCSAPKRRAPGGDGRLPDTALCYARSHPRTALVDARSTCFSCMRARPLACMLPHWQRFPGNPTMSPPPPPLTPSPSAAETTPNDTTAACCCTRVRKAAVADRLHCRGHREGISGPPGSPIHNRTPHLRACPLTQQTRAAGSGSGGGRPGGPGGCGAAGPRRRHWWRADVRAVALRRRRAAAGRGGVPGGPRRRAEGRLGPPHRHAHTVRSPASQPIFRARRSIEAATMCQHRHAAVTPSLPPYTRRRLGDS